MSQQPKYHHWYYRHDSTTMRRIHVSRPSCGQLMIETPENGLHWAVVRHNTRNYVYWVTESL